MLTTNEIVDNLVTSFGDVDHLPPYILGLCQGYYHASALPWPFRPGLFKQRLRQSALGYMSYSRDVTILVNDVLIEIERGYILAALELNRAELLADWDN
jgi:hypothetical protein